MDKSNQLFHLFIFFVLFLGFLDPSVDSWVSPTLITTTSTSRPTTTSTFRGEHALFLVAFASKNDDNNDKKSGYKFGDFTKALGRKVTGDENYKFGDISRKLDQKAKARVTELTGKDEYKFGDLSTWADSQAKEKIANYTGKADYQVGDITKEVVRRAWAGEYDLEDVVLAFRVLLQLGASFLPIARLLPVKLLLEVLNVGLAGDVGAKVTGAVAKSLDERFKEAITGDAKYQLGDASKKQLSTALSKFTGKDSYSFGDISQLVATRLSDQSYGSSDGSKATKKVDKAVLEELANDDALAKWDKKFVDETNAGKDTPTKR